MVDDAAGDSTSSPLVALTFSGAGSRAAALAQGILKELAGIDIEWEGRRRRMLDEVDSIAAVSGGSVTAACYAHCADRLFADFRPRFLHRDIDADFTRRLLNPARWPQSWSPFSGRSDLLADIFDELLFDGATFGDMGKGPGRAYLKLSATDKAAGTRFEFVQERFDLMCADLARSSIARGHGGFSPPGGPLVALGAPATPALAALTAGLAPLELGSDIGGSIRDPAGWCGVFGHQPSAGLLPQRGHIPAPPGTQSGADIAVVGSMARPTCSSVPSRQMASGGPSPASRTPVPQALK